MADTAAMMVCANCLTSGEPTARAGDVAVCPTCGSSVVLLADGVTRRATGRDTDALQPGERALLVKARSAIVRPERRSR